MFFEDAIRTIGQLCFDFAGGHKQKEKPRPFPSPIVTHQEHDTPEEPLEESEDADGGDWKKGRDAELEQQCQAMLTRLGLSHVLHLVTVHWNSRLRSTAGYAAYPSWRIELNPRLIPLEGQVDRTLKHELAHLVAYHRAGRRRIEPHGHEWRQACADLGIPGEPAHHRLPFPRSTMQRNHTYQCPSCQTVVGRVRPFKRATACLACCRKVNRGQFDPRFKFVKVQPSQDPSA